jgi:hypothetical protein
MDAHWVESPASMGNIIAVFNWRTQMRCRITYKLVLPLAAIFLILFGQAAHASLVFGPIQAGVGNEDPIETYHRHIDSYLLDGWFIGPRTVEADSDAGPWIKNLRTPGNSSPEMEYLLVEVVRVGERLAWTDWHEEILTPGWEWNWGTLLPIPTHDWDELDDYDLRDHPRLRDLLVWGDISGNGIDFSFDPLEPYSWLLVVKGLSLSDADSLPGIDCASQWISVAEHPSAVPVPAAVWLLGSGLIGLVGIRFRKAS